MKKPHKIQVLVYTLTLALAFTGILRSDTVSVFGTERPENEIFRNSFCGAVIPLHSPLDEKRDTGNIYADTSQLAVPRNTSVGSQPRQIPTAKRPLQCFSSAATFKDGKVITRNTFDSYSSYIDLFPSGTRDFRIRLLSLRKLII